MSTKAGIRLMRPKIERYVLPFNIGDSIRRIPQRPEPGEDLLAVLCLNAKARFGKSLLVH